MNARTLYFDWVDRIHRSLSLLSIVYLTASIVPFIAQHV